MPKQRRRFIFCEDFDKKYLRRLKDYSNRSIPYNLVTEIKVDGEYVFFYKFDLYNVLDELCNKHYTLTRRRGTHHLVMEELLVFADIADYNLFRLMYTLPEMEAA